MVRHLHLGHSPGLYVLTSEHEVEYLYCERCAKVAAVSPETLNPVRQQIEDRFGYRPRFTHFAIVGVCQECLRESKPKRRASSSTKPQHFHSHGDYVHSHPGRARHTH